MVVFLNKHYKLSRKEGLQCTCKLTVDMLALGVYSSDPMLMFDFGKSSIDTATANVPFRVWFAGNDIIQVFCLSN